MVTHGTMGGAGYPLVYMANRQIFRTSKESKKKNQQEQVGTQNRAAQLSLARRGQRQRSTGHRTSRRKSIPWKTSRNEKRGVREATRTQTVKKKGTGLTSHSTAKDFMIQFPSDGVVPRQRLGQIS